MKETELAEIVIDWLEIQHWDVYQEVQFSAYDRIADIVAVRAGMLWIIECKTSMTFTVLEQAYRWPSHFRSIAIPKARERKGREFAYLIAERYLNVGILKVSKDKFSTGVYEYLDPPLMREFHKSSKRMIGQLREEHKHYAKAGSSNGGYYTPYRRTMKTVKNFVTNHPGCTLKEIMNDLGENHHYASNQSARTSIRKALSFWEDWCKVDINGKEFRYYLATNTDN